MSYNVEEIRKDFPILSTQVNGHDLVYLDNAATTLKPKQVVDVISEHYLLGASNVHRGVHTLSSRATDQYEQARKTLAKFVNARSEREIVFTTGTTASLNLVALSYVANFLKEGDEVFVSETEHHSNIVPWQMVAEKNNLSLKVIKMNSRGELDLEHFKSMISDRSKFLSVGYISNAIGSFHPVEKLIEIAHSHNMKVCIDGAQSPCHIAIDVQKLDCDFFALSSHKMCGPTGIGLLYAKEELLEKMPPIFGGGDMISEVRFEKSTWNDIPFKFEAGTPHIAGVLGFGAAADYLIGIGLENISKYEHELNAYAKQELEKIEGIQFFGTAENKVSIFSFGFEGIHSADLGTIMDKYGVAVRTGHHCTQPLMRLFKVSGTARASFAFYNNKSDVDKLVFAINKAKEFLL